MSKLRSECKNAAPGSAIPNETALFLIRDAVARRRGLIHGKLDDGRGHYCAIGSFWEDNPDIALRSSLIDEVAAVNDSLGPSATSHQRWKKVTEWLRWKIKTLAARK
jgi:hypothetical protein